MKKRVILFSFISQKYLIYDNWFLLCLMYSEWSTWGFLLTWCGNFVREKKKKKLTNLLRCEIRVFYNYESLDYTIKSYFLNIFLDWIKLYIGDRSWSVLEFVDWLDSYRTHYFVFVFLCFFFGSLDCFVFIVYTLFDL